jgi:hypothetical protein
MAEVTREVRLSAPAGEIWALVGGFNDLPKWHPAVLSSQDDGATIRHLVIVGRIRLAERLLSHDDAARTYRYTIADGPLPVEGYVSTVTVVDNGDGTCTVCWSARFEPAGAPAEVAVEAIEGIYDSGLNSLADRFGRAA